MNVLVLGGRVIGPELASDLVTAYLHAAFTRKERHQRRLQKIDAIERRYGAHAPPLPKGTHRSPVITSGAYEAALLDMDGVITDTASIHATCWKTMFDEFLQTWAAKTEQPFRAFDIVMDYKLHVDGKPRYQGVRDFLKSRGIVLPEGTPRPGVIQKRPIVGIEVRESAFEGDDRAGRFELPDPAGHDGHAGSRRESAVQAPAVLAARAPMRMHNDGVRRSRRVEVRRQPWGN
jgi:ribose/galactose isomerase